MIADLFPCFLPPPGPGLGAARPHGLLILGEEVSFLPGHGKEAIVANADQLLVRDLSGKEWDSCDLYVLWRGKSPFGLGFSDQDLLQEAGKYYGAEANLVDVPLAKPKGPWQARGQIDTLWYRRKGSYAARYTHRFARPVLLESTARGEYRLRLLDGCIANERGIVFP